MGVASLLKHLSPCLTESHVEQYRGKTVAIDGNTFLFRGCYSCSEQVATGQPCSGPVDYLLKRVNMLKHYGVKPWVVLDGRRTPMKDGTNQQRREEREKNLQIASDLRRQADEKSGAERDALELKAQTFFQKAIRVTRQMVTNAMAALKRESVACMVAPYEADAQVAFLAKCGLASAVITEDSDILVYMAAAKSNANVLYKMDEFGRCKELGFDAEKISSLPGEIGKFGRGLAAFSGEGGGRLFVQLAALAGCDYVDNVKGLGLLTALPIISRFRTVPADRRVKRILMHLHKTGKTVPDGHRDRMLLAEMSFFWHRVYDPRSKTCVHFCDAVPELIGTAEIPSLSLTTGGLAFLGEHIDDEMMADISRGRVDPTTGERVLEEVLPAPNSAGARRSMSQPDRTSVGPANAVGTAKSVTLPMMTTPRGTSNRQQAPQGAGRSPYPRNPRKRLQGASRRRTKDTCVNQTPRSGFLKDMFDRAKTKARKEDDSNKENLPPGLADVCAGSSPKLALGCKPGLTPSRDRITRPQLTAVAAAGVPNPFANKPGSARAVKSSPRDFLTPVATVGGGDEARTDESRPCVRENAGGGEDVWSRLSKVYPVGAHERREPPIILDEAGATKEEKLKPRENQENDCGGSTVRGAKDGSICVPALALESTGTIKPVCKRPLSSITPESNNCDGTGKRDSVDGTRSGKKARCPPSGGKGTMLSFFGRVAVSKP